MTGWYATLLQPIGTGTPYAVVNYVRLPSGPIRFLGNQLTRPSFYRYVRAHLRSNSVTAMPVLFERV